MGESGVERDDLKYRAFISYSRVDRESAVALQARLERYVLPQALRLVKPGLKLDPRPLKPVFRDEDELVPGQDLTARIQAGLRGSEYLIVVCSPAAAASEWVEKEILEFCALGKGDNVLAIVVGGQPHAEARGMAVDLESLPRALRYEPEPDGADGVRVSGTLAEPLWVDWRDKARNDRTGFLRIVAGLLSLSSLDELIRRDARARRRQTIERSIAAVVAALALIVGGGSLLGQLHAAAAVRSDRLAAAANVADTGGDPRLAIRLALTALHYHVGAAAEAALVNAVLDDRQIGAPINVRGAVTSVALSPDGRRIVSSVDGGIVNGAPENTVRIWDAATGQEIGAPLNGHTGHLNSVAFSPDGRRIVSGSQDKTIRLWDATTGQEIGAPLTGHTDEVTSVAFSQDGLRVVSGSLDKTVRLWDATAGREIGGPLTGHADRVTSVAFSPDGGRVVSGSYDNTIRLWDAATAHEIGAPLVGHTSPVLSVAFSPDGQRIVSGSGDLNARESSDTTVRIWDAATGREIGAPLTGQKLPVLSVAFSPDGRRIVSGSVDQTLRLWDATTGQEIGAPLTGHSGSVWSVAFSRDGQRIVSGSDDDTIRIWDGSGQEIGAPLIGHSDYVRFVAFSPDGGRLLSTSNDLNGSNEIRLWDTASGQEIGAPRHADVSAAAFSPDGLKIVSVSGDMTLRLWDARTGREIGAPRAGPVNQTDAVAISPDGRLIASEADGVVRAWDAATYHEIGAPLHLGDYAGALAFSPDGRRIVIAAQRLTLWDVATGTEIGNPSVALEQVESVAFSPDGRRIVSTSDDTTLRLWDGTTGQEIGAPLAGDTGPVWVAAFSPDGSRVVSGSADKTVRIWDVVTHQEIGAALIGHTNGVQAVAFSRDGRRVASGSADQTVRVWDVDRAVHLTGSALVRVACEQKLTGGLVRFSAEELRDYQSLLDPDLDVDACHPARWWGLFERLGLSHSPRPREP
jgi:WD40 repeat protein